MKKNKKLTYSEVEIKDYLLRYFNSMDLESLKKLRDNYLMEYDLILQVIDLKELEDFKKELKTRV